MVVTVRSLGLAGISGYEVSAECFLSGGLPAFDVVGLPDAAVREARERVRAAVKNCGAKFPVSRITVNLAPAGQKKEGTVYDLPIFVGILAAGGDLPALPGDAAFLGELSLTGALRGVAGVLPMDKVEIIRISREIGTFDTSILPYEDCCTVFTPRHPCTRPILEEVRAAEAALDTDALTERALAGEQWVRVKY